MKLKFYLMKKSNGVVRCMYVLLIVFGKIEINSSMYASFVFFPFEYFSMVFSLNVCMDIVHIYFNVLYDDFGFFSSNCMIIIISLFITLYCCLLEFRVCAVFFLLLYIIPFLFVSVFVSLVEFIMLIW
jgi:hypothetical protein